MREKENPGAWRQNRGFHNHPSLNYTASNPIDNLLSRLEGVKETSPGKWLARCPAHDDRNPSLSVKETDDGKVLVHCFAGCAFNDIVSAVGLEVSDLFPRQHGRDFDPTAPRAKPPRFWASELLELAALEARIVAIAACDLAAGVALSADDLTRVHMAAEVLAALVLEVKP